MLHIYSHNWHSRVSTSSKKRFEQRRFYSSPSMTKLFWQTTADSAFHAPAAATGQAGGDALRLGSKGRYGSCVGGR